MERTLHDPSAELSCSPRALGNQPRCALYDTPSSPTLAAPPGRAPSHMLQQAPSSTSSKPAAAPEPEGVALLRKERQQACFDVEALHTVLAGGAERLAQRNRVKDALAADPIFSKTRDPYLPRTQRHIGALGRARRLKGATAR